jgi:prepilin-type N-terminal cleavage/methylation domain-containing protein/prepilin-type processing-associated H-X9-DG protein
MRVRSARARRSHAAGFTLVELLVVIGIIALLISILLPSLARARQEGQRAKCLSNLKSIGNALVMYMNQSGGFAPDQINNGVPDCLNPAVYDSAVRTQRNVYGSLLPQIGGRGSIEIYKCPLALDDKGAVSPGTGPLGDSDASYLVNGYCIGKKITRIKQSPEIIFIQEDRYRFNYCWLRPARSNPTANARQIYSAWCYDQVANGGQEYSNLHPMKPVNGGGNFLFADGHCEWRPHDGLRPKDFGLTGGAGVTGADTDDNHVPQSQTYYGIYE